MEFEEMPDYVASSETLPKWMGIHTISPDTTIQNQLQSLLETTLAECHEPLPDDLFSLSPLTSPESSGASTPSAHSLPHSTAAGASLPLNSPPAASATTLSTPSQSSGMASPTATPNQPSPLFAKILAAKLQALSQPPPSKKPRVSKALTQAQLKRKCARKDRAKDARRKHRQDTCNASYGNRPPPLDARQTYVAAGEPIFTPTDTKRASVASTAFVGLDRGEVPAGVVFLEDLVGESSRFRFALQRWDGVQPLIVIDRDGRIIAILAGRPDDPSWETVQHEAADLLEGARWTCRVPKKSQHHRRGAFTTLRCGFSHGGGQSFPQNLFNGKRNARVINKLNRSKPIRRIAGFGSSVFQTWAPELHKYYVEKLGALQRHDPSLKRPFQNSVFSSTTYNLGPKTVCEPHLDFANVPFGFCAITALGKFDATRGGHIVLWECKLVIEFPAGATILIPSAIIHHSNVPIAAGEVRYSMTQYVAGGLIRWVDHGFELTEIHRASLTPKALGDLDHRNKNRWAMGLSLMPRLPSVSTA